MNLENELSATSSSDIDCRSETPRKEDEDYRVKCKSKQGLDRLLSLAIEQVTELAESQDLGDYTPVFVSNFTENFVQIMQENLTVNSLPWVVQIQESEEQNEITKNMLSSLCKQLETVTSKRKTYPKKICRTYGSRLRHERQNIRSGNIKYDFPHPSSVPNIGKSLNFTKEYQDSSKNLISSHDELRKELDDLLKLEEIQAKVKDILKRNKPIKHSLSDTGYLND